VSRPVEKTAPATPDLLRGIAVVREEPLHFDMNEPAFGSRAE
jgi:hypothetical protein